MSQDDLMALDSTNTNTDTDIDIDINPMMHLVAPLVAYGATVIVRRVINSGYKRVTKNDAPKPNDPGVSLGTALMWAIATAAVAAGVEVAVYRLTNQAGSKRS